MKFRSLFFVLLLLSPAACHRPDASRAAPTSPLTGRIDPANLEIKETLAPGIVRRELNASLYRSAKELLDRVFKDEAGEDLGAADEVLASLRGEDYVEAETDKVVTTSRFWVAVEQTTQRVGGIVGLYRYADDQEAEWLNWFAVHPDFRGKKLGPKLLEGAIAEAKRSGRTYLRLFTDDEPYEAAAQFVYEAQGLKMIKKEAKPGTPYHRIFRELNLKSNEAAY